MNIRPLSNRVIVKPDEAPQVTSGGIIIPDTARETPHRGTVVAAGNGLKDEPMIVKVGDSVLYGRHSGTRIEYDGAEYFIMRESDILAII